MSDKYDTAVGKNEHNHKFCVGISHINNINTAILPILFIARSVCRNKTTELIAT